MNLLFIHYGSLGDNSLNHIGLFAGELASRGADCRVVVADRKGEGSFPCPVPVLTRGEWFASACVFTDGEAADIVHAWTPRETVREVLDQIRWNPRMRLILHLEDNEDHLIESHSGKSIETLVAMPDSERRSLLNPRLSDPILWRGLLWRADAVSVITPRLLEFVPDDCPSCVLSPGIDPVFRPQPADTKLRESLGIAPHEAVIVYPGGTSFANEPDILDLYRAVVRLNHSGVPVRLVRTGPGSQAFHARIAPELSAGVIDLGMQPREALPRLLALADVLVQPGRPGPFNDHRLPSKLPEFFAMGKPVVLPDANLAHEIVDGRHAIILRRGDPVEIAEVCRRILKDPVLAGALGSGASALAASRFNLTANTTVLARLHAQVLAADFASDTRSQPTAACARWMQRLARQPKPPGNVAGPLPPPPPARGSGLLDFFQLQEQWNSRLLAAERIWRAECEQRDRRLLRAQESLVWRLAEPFRAWSRRRARLARDTGAASEPGVCARRGFRLRYSLDRCTPAFGYRRAIDIGGWAFFEQPAGPVSQVRLRLGEDHLPLATGLNRPDVGTAFPSRKDASTSGYSGTGIPVPGSTPIDSGSLEVLFPDGIWEVVESFRLPDPVHPSLLAAADYPAWVEREDTPTSEDLENLRSEAAAWMEGGRPRFSILMPVYNPDPQHLAAAIQSVLDQTYPDWELCIADDASPDPRVREVLGSFAAQDARVRLVLRETNGHISEASNSALALASREWIALLDHDDLLPPHALHVAARVLRSHPETRYAYTDEDKIGSDGRRFDPYFKPDWSPDLLCSQHYACHLSIYSRRAVNEVGGFRIGFEGSQDWDLALRVTEQAPPGTVRHIPHILYHWRVTRQSTAGGSEAKEYTVAAALRAVSEHLFRTGQSGRVETGPFPGSLRVRHQVPPETRVALIVPTRDCAQLLGTCVESLLHRSSWRNLNLVLVDNGTREPAALLRLRELAGHPAVTWLKDPGDFNFSRLCNLGADAASQAEVLIFVNNDVSPIDFDWVEVMAGQALRKDIGAVGARLFFPDGTLQHAGVVLGIGPDRLAGHAFQRQPVITRGGNGRSSVVTNPSAVTGACLAVQREKFAAVGGFDAQAFPVSFNDLDLCLRLGARGWRTVYTPFARLTHHEGASRGKDTPASPRRMAYEEEAARFRARWASVLAADPAYNPNLTVEADDFSMAVAPRVPRPWEITART